MAIKLNGINNINNRFMAFSNKGILRLRQNNVRGSAVDDRMNDP